MASCCFLSYILSTVPMAIAPYSEREAGVGGGRGKSSAFLSGLFCCCVKFITCISSEFWQTKLVLSRLIFRELCWSALEDTSLLLVVDISAVYSDLGSCVFPLSLLWATRIPDLELAKNCIQHTEASYLWCSPSCSACLCLSLCVGVCVKCVRTDRRGYQARLSKILDSGLASLNGEKKTRNGLKVAQIKGQVLITLSVVSHFPQVVRWTFPSWPFLSFQCLPWPLIFFFLFKVSCAQLALNLVEPGQL